MAPSTLARRLSAVALVAMLAIVVVACAPAGTPAEVASPTPSPSQGASATAAASPADPSPSLAGRDAPPDAALAADGGDPVTGQLGTYLWFDSGSDAPWLPGAPLRVGAGEPLTVQLDPDGAIERWTARLVPAAAGGPAGARALGEGTVPVAFEAPESGDWTVEVSITFADGAGQASYFWRLQVE